MFYADRHTCTLRKEDGGRFRIEGMPAGRHRILIEDTRSGRWQIGIDADNQPVTITRGQVRLYVNEVTLEPGQPFRLICPEGSAHLAPEGWMQEGVSPEDKALREQLVGVWIGKRTLPDGRRIGDFLSFTSDGRWSNGASRVRGRLYVGYDFYFKVANGSVEGMTRDGQRLTTLENLRFINRDTFSYHLGRWGL